MNYYYNPYDKKVRRLRFRNRLVAIMLAAAIGTGGYSLYKNYEEKNKKPPVVQSNIEMVLDNIDPNYESRNMEVVPTVVPTAVPTALPTVEPRPVFDIEPPVNNYVGGDSVVATSDVNMRLNASKDSFKLGVLDKGSVVDRLYTDGDWDIIRTGDKIAYVHGDYTRTNDVDYNNEYYHVESYNDIVRTTDKLYFRLGPSKSEKEICLLDKGEELVVIGKAITNSKDVWYLVRARGQIGFVSSQYTKSLRNILTSVDPSITDVSIKKMAYLKNDSPLYNTNYEVAAYGDQYQLVQVLQSDDKYSLVNMDGVVGYVDNSSIKTIKGSFVAVDLSDQRIYYYCDTDVAFAGKCTTGKKSTPTEIGLFTPYGKASHHDFANDHNANILWMPFNGGQGLHDAPWEANNKFGDPSYTSKHGSAGCVRLPNDVAQFIFDNVSKSTPVLVKK